MPKRKAHKSRRGDVQRIALQRTLVYLAALRPGVPMPLVFLQNLVSGDLMFEESNATVLENLAAAPARIQAGLEQLCHLTIQDAGRASVTVTEAQRDALHTLIRELGPDTSWVAANGLDDPTTSCVSELHIGAALDPDSYTPDQRALLAVHGLFWLEQALAQADEDGAYAAAQLYDALWFFYDQEAVALSELTPLLPRVIQHCKQYGPGWSDTGPLYYLTSVAEALVEAEEPTLRPWAEQVLTLAGQIAADYPTAERKEVTKLLRRVRKRTGL
jgi:hypothetical protein